MSFNEMFDKIIRRKVSEAESDFPFDDANWQNMSRMMDAERGSSGLNRTGKVFLLFGSLFFIIAVVSIFSLINSPEEKNNIAENKAILTDNNILNNNNQPLSGKHTNGAQSTVGSENNNSNELNPVSDINTVSKNPDTGNNEASDVNSGSGGNENTSFKNSRNTAGLTNGNNTNGSTDNNADNGFDNQKSANGNVSMKEANSGVKKGNSGSQPKNIGVNNNGKMASSIRQVLGAEKKSQAKKQKNYSLGKSNSTEEKIVAQPNPEILGSGANISKETENSDNLLEMRSSILQIWKKDASLRTSAYDFIRLDDEYYKRNRRKTHFMNVEAGTTYLFGWETAKGRDGKGFNAFAGINYGVYLSKKTSISAGVQLYNVSNIKQAFYTKSNLDYDFGSSGNFTNITANSLYYFSVPVKAYYKIGKNRIGLGINAGFLFNGKNSIETYSEADNVKRNVVVTKNSGYYEGISKTNILVSAFYTQSIYRRLKLNGEVVYGLSDTYKNSAKSGTFERNIGLKLSLQYTLFDK